MKTKLLCAALALLLLTACTTRTICPPMPSEAMPTPQPVRASPEPAATLACRIVDGAEDGRLLLAGTADGGVYSLSAETLAITLDGAPARASDLRDGMLVDVFYDGAVQETYPMGLSGAAALNASTEDRNDLCGLYLQVLEDLWAVDSGLNDGIDQIGMDLSGLTDLSGSEKAAIMWRFAGSRGLELITGTWQELVDQGYIDGEKLVWEDGLHVSLEGSAEEFDARKWRGGLGAYFFVDCAARAEDGEWRYTVGSEAIS